MTTGTGEEPARTVLIDTTLLIQQQKRRADAEVVRTVLSVYRFKGASSYSKLEFKRAWLQRLGYILTLCDEARNVADVLALLNKRLGSNPFQHRMLTTCFEQLTGFLDISVTPASTPGALAQLRTHCRNAILSASVAYGRMITGEFRSTGCVRAEELPSGKPGDSLNLSIRRCSANHKRCRVDEFFCENATHFQRIADHIERLESASEELRKAREQVLTAKEDPTSLLDGKGCARLADAIIAIDGNSMDDFAANNDRDWAVLADAMAKPLVNPVKGTRREPAGS